MKNFDEQSKELSESPQETLIEFFRNSPLLKADLDLERALDYGRDIQL